MFSIFTIETAILQFYHKISLPCTFLEHVLSNLAFRRKLLLVDNLLQVSKELLLFFTQSHRCLFFMSAYSFVLPISHEYSQSFLFVPEMPLLYILTSKWVLSTLFADLNFDLHEFYEKTSRDK